MMHVIVSPTLHLPRRPVKLQLEQHIPFSTKVKVPTKATRSLTQFQQLFLEPHKLVCHTLYIKGLPPQWPAQSLPVSRTWFRQDIHTPGTETSQQSVVPFLNDSKSAPELGRNDTDTCIHQLKKKKYKKQKTKNSPCDNNTMIYF